MLEKRITLHKWDGMGWNKWNPSNLARCHLRNHTQKLLSKVTRLTTTFVTFGVATIITKKKKKSLSTLLILFIYFKNRDGNRFN